MSREQAQAVARRAAEQALAAGVELPDDLALWRLAGGRPPADAVAGPPDELGELLEATYTPASRRRLGAHYTPRVLAEGLVARAIDARRGPQVGDPACGGGALLLAAGRHLAARGEAPADVLARLWGSDVDPLAVATTEAALALWAGSATRAGNFSVGDALECPPAWPLLDVLVGNPPFLGQLRADTARRAASSALMRERFGPAARAYTDTSALFLLAALRSMSPTGTVAMVQPQSVLGARDSAAVRAAVSSLGALTDVWFPGRGFEAAVDVCVPLIRLGHPSPDCSWSSHLARHNGVPAVELSPGPVLGDEVTTVAGFRSEYYGMADHVREQSDCPGGVPVLTTGLVDLGGNGWGKRRGRIAKRAWERPVIDAERLDGNAARWAARCRQPKLLVAPQTRVVEVMVDAAGEWLAGVPLVIVLAPTQRLPALAAALASPAVTAWALHETAGTARSPHALKVTAELLRRAPLPADPSAWERGTEAFAARDLQGFASAMTVAYGTTPELAGWWMERAEPVWSRG